MPWFFSIPEFLKKRACRYLLQHYLGQFLEEKISLDDLTVDLYNGTGSIHNIPLNVQAVNDSLSGGGMPVRVVSGFIECVTVSVPWAALLKESCVVELSGLTVSVAPHRLLKLDEYMSMTDSLFFSMTSSRQMAEEVLRGGPAAGETGGEHSPGFEGMEALAQAIELVLARVQITLKDTVFQINYEPPDLAQVSRHFLQLRIGRIEYYDEVSKMESSVDAEEEKAPPAQSDFAIKVLHLTDLSLEVGTNLPSAASTMDESSSWGANGSGGVPIAVAGGKLTLKITIKQNEMVPGPKVEVAGFLGTLHLLLSPQQLSMLQEIAEGVAAQGIIMEAPHTAHCGVVGFERLPPGQSRPIPHDDRTTIESQLTRYQQLEQQKARASLLHKRQDLLDADPWENSVPHSRGPMNPSLPPHLLVPDSGGLSSSSSEHFYSLDLTSPGSLSSSAVSCAAGMEDSFLSTSSQLLPPYPPTVEKGVGVGGAWGGSVHRRYSDDFDEAIALHEGVGLQQLSQSPPHQHHFSSFPRKPPQSNTRPPRPGPNPPSCKYALTLSGMTVALLEADPAHIYTTRLTTSSVEPLVGVAVPAAGCSMDEGGLDPIKYFELVSELLKDGVNQHQLDLHHKELAQVLPADHLMLWLSVVRGSALMQEETSWECELTVGCGQVWEYLYHNHTRINYITTPVSVSPILQLHGDSTHMPPKPALKLKVSSSLATTSRKKSRADCIQTDVEAFLSGLDVNLDLTLIDRLQLLLCRGSSDTNGFLKTNSLEKVKHSLYMTTSNMHTIHQQRQAVFNQAVAPNTTSHSKNHRFNIKISGDVIHASLRFPVPECGKTQHPPWFTSSLRTEILFVELEEWLLSGHLHPLALAGEAPYKLDYQFALAQAYLSLDGTVEERQLFLIISAKKSEASSLDTPPAISLEVRPAPDSSLDRPPSPSSASASAQHCSHSVILDPYLLEESMETVTGIDTDTKPDPQPFSQRKSMFLAGDNMASKGAEGQQQGAAGGEGHSEELVLPGTVAEMKEFADFVSSASRYHLNCFLPEVRVHLPSKYFLETLCNRFGSDLVLWEPATPAAVSKANAKSVMYSCMDLLQPAATSEERFLMCKSVLREENSDDEADDVSPVEGDVVGGATGVRSRSLSSWALSLRVEDGLISMLPEVLESASPISSSVPSHHNSSATGEDSDLFHSTTNESLGPTLVQLSPQTTQGSTSCGGEHGLALMELASIQAFFVSGFQGDSTHDCVCAWVQDVALYHHGNPGEKYSCVDKTFDLSVCDQLLAVFGPAPILLPSEQPMFSLAMEVHRDEEHSTKTSKMAVSVSNTAMLYHVTHTGLGAIEQLANFFDWKEEVLEGREPPSVVTELHAHLINCQLEYRPLYLPLVATLVLDSVSLSTSVVTGAPVHVVRMVLDGLHLLLTPSPSQSQAHGGETKAPPLPHSVCVMDVEWLEVTLRHCNNELLSEDFQKLFPKMPDVSLECASNAVHFRMCVDSCIALCDLLLYLSAQQDLSPNPEPPTRATGDYSSLPSSLPSSSSASTASSVPGVSTGGASGVGVSGSLLTSHQDLAEEGVGPGSDIGDLITDAMEDFSPTESVAVKVGRTKREKVLRVSHMHKMEMRVTGESMLIDFDSDSDNDAVAATRSGVKKHGFLGSPLPGPSPASGDAGRGRVRGETARKGVESGHGSIFSDSDDDFCIVHTPTSTKVAPGAEPKVKCLLEEGEELIIVEDHFTLPVSAIVERIIPDGQMDQLHRPRSFPDPQTQYTLKEMTLVWHLYGGRDFSVPPAAETVRGRRGPERERQSKDRTSLRCWSGKNMGLHGTSWKSGGGAGRDHTVLVEVELDKVRLQHETYPSSFEQSARLVALIGTVEIRDRLADSHINKLLYQYTTEAMPKQSHASMVTLKVLFTKPDVQDLEEASVYLSILPIRLNMDQDTVLFLYEFTRQVGNLGLSQLPPEPVRCDVDGPSTPKSRRSQPCPSLEEASGSVSSKPHLVFIKSFMFQPDLPIRFDYEAKGFKTEMGTIAGILFGLSHLNNSEVSLKALHYKKGLLGWDKLVEYSTNEWMADIKGYQLPLLLKGVGPMHNVTQLVYGLMDFVRLPYQQYREDGRLVWGIQRGTSALTSSTGVAVVELTSQLLETIQGLAQMAYDMVSPSGRTAQPPVNQPKPYQPLDFREGFSNAYDVVYAGIGGTAVDLYSVASKEHRERGVAGAVGGVLRHLPGTFVKPIILASEATRHVLGGVKNQFVPDARREAHEKWKSNEQFEETRKL